MIVEAIFFSTVHLRSSVGRGELGQSSLTMGIVTNYYLNDIVNYTYAMPFNFPKGEFIYFLFMTSTYRDLADFFAPLAPEAGRLDNKASKGSTFWADEGGKVDDGLDDGKAGF